VETHDFFWHRDDNNAQQGPQQDPVQINSAISDITARDGMLIVNSEAAPAPARPAEAGSNVYGLPSEVVELLQRNASITDWPTVSNLLQREFNFSPVTVTNYLQAPEPGLSDDTGLTEMEEAEWNSRYRNRSFTVSKAYYTFLVVSDNIIDNLKQETKHTFNQLIFNSRRRTESRLESLYASNDPEDLARIEMLRIFELMLRDARFYFNSLTYIEQEYIPPLSSDGFTSGLRGVLLIDFITRLLNEIDYEKSDYISSELRAQMRLLLAALVDTKLEMLAKLNVLEIEGRGFNLESIRRSYDRDMSLDAVVPDGFLEYVNMLSEESTWIEHIAERLHDFDMSVNARYYDEFELFRRQLATENEPAPIASTVYPPSGSREVTPIIGAIPATPLPSANQTRWELITRDGSGFVGLRVNGVTVETLSSVRAYSESGGLTKLSLEVYIVPGRSTLTFSSQLSDTIRNTEGNAPPVVGGSVHDRFMDL
jgi:hypothetical protein